MKLSLFKHKKEETDSEKESEELLKEERQGMIRGITELSETSVKEIMIPRIDVDSVSIDITLDALMDKVYTSGHSRLPVYSGAIDNVVGVLYVKDLIYFLRKRGEPFDLTHLIRKAYFVPETKRIDTLLREFKKRHLHIAIAVDEYGGIAGIITMEDIIEEIIGDIQDEFDNEPEYISEISENIWMCDARADLDDINEKLEADFPSEEFDSLGGFVFDLFGKIPVKFETISYEDFEFIIQEMDGYRINLIKVIKRKTGEKNEN